MRTSCSAPASRPICVRSGAFPSTRREFSGATWSWTWIDSGSQADCVRGCVRCGLVLACENALLQDFLCASMLFDDAIAGDVPLARQFHALLLDEGAKQRIHGFHDAQISMDFKVPMCFDGAYALILDVTRNHAGECAPQIGGQQMGGLLLVQFQIAHVAMRWQERHLKLVIDLQRPIEIIGIAALFAEFAHLFDASQHFLRHARRIIDDDLVAALRHAAQSETDEFIDLREVSRRFRRPGKNKREGQILIARMQENAKDVQNFLGRPCAAGKDHDAMAETHECLKPFSMSGMITKSLTMGLGDSAAMMPGSVMLCLWLFVLCCLVCLFVAPFMGPFMA